MTLDATNQYKGLCRRVAPPRHQGQHLRPPFATVLGNCVEKEVGCGVLCFVLGGRRRQLRRALLGGHDAQVTEGRDSQERDHAVSGQEAQGGAQQLRVQLRLRGHSETNLPNLTLYYLSLAIVHGLLRKPPCTMTRPNYM